MVAMTQDMKDMISNNLCYIATVDENGYPDIGPKISMQVKDDSHLFYYERTARQHLHNLRENGKMVVAVATKDNKHGYRFHGPVELVDSGEFYDEAIAFADANGLKHPAVVPVMTITRIDLLDAGPKAGTIIVQD